LLNVTSQHALRAVVYIAEHGQRAPVLARDIAADTLIPFNYLQRVLRELVRNGVLHSVRGHGGGFALNRPADQLLLDEVLAPFDDTLRGGQCPFGKAQCSADNPCAFHEAWRPVIEAYRAFLTSHSVNQIAEADRLHEKQAGDGK